MKITFFSVFAPLVLAASLAYGGALSVSNSKGFDTNQLVDKDGVLLTNLDPVLVVMGTFASEPSSAIPGASQVLGAGTYSALLAEFTSYGSSVGMSPASGLADLRGSFLFQEDQLVGASALAGKAIYVVVAKGLDLATATQVAIIRTTGIFEASDDDSPLPKMIGVGTGLGCTVIAGSDTLFNIAANGSDPSADAAYSLAEVVIAPEIVVEEPLDTDLEDGTASISFGSETVGVSGIAKTFTIRNSGSADLTGLSVTVDGTEWADFVVNDIGMLTTLAPMGMTDFTVTFTPGGPGMRNAALHILSNDANENPFDIALTGTGDWNAPTDLALSPAIVAENLASGTVVGLLTATDADAGDSFTYALVTGVGDADNSSFAISGDQLLTAEVFDHEVQMSASIMLRVVDSLGFEYEEGLFVTITDDRGEDFDGDGLTEAEEEDLYGTSDLDSDSDEDGFEDAYEVLYGFDPSSILDGTLDRDVDGWLDWLEVRLGTDPDVSGPGLDFAVFANGAGEPTVRVGPGGTLLGFFVERSTTLQAPWVQVADFPVGLPLGQTLEWIDENPPAADEAFYRVGANPLPVPVTAADGFTWVTVGDAANVVDPATTYGAVAAEFQISAHEVTIGQWVEFLNEKQKSQPADSTKLLFIFGMTTNLNVAGIQRNGSDGSYTYSAIGSPDRPVSNVSWLDAARYVNWLHNGKGNGDTESGVYEMSLSLELIVRAAGASYYLPTRDEWYKAAYYDPSKGGSNYWLYATQSDTAPDNDFQAGMNRANHRDGDYTLTPGDNTYSGTTQYLTPVGAFVGSASYYGTYDQAGNVWEWTESTDGLNRDRRGGSWSSSFMSLQSTTSDPRSPEVENSGFGFRVAKPAGM